MSSVSEILLFPVADALQVALHLIGDGYKAGAPRKTKIGQWEISMDMKVKSDVLSDFAASFFVRVRKNLWLYVVSYGFGTKLKCVVFDASVAKIQNGFMETPCTQGDLSVTLKRLSAIGGQVFNYDDGTAKWEPSDLDDLLPAGKGALK
jgi:hypothetical protein